MSQETRSTASSAAPIEQSTPGIILTPRAQERVVQMLKKEGLGERTGLRVAVTGGGCSGFQYELNFDERKEGDTEVAFDGLRVYIDDNYNNIPSEGRLPNDMKLVSAVAFKF